MSRAAGLLLALLPLLPPRLAVAATAEDRSDALRRRADLSYVEPSREAARAEELGRLLAEPPEPGNEWFSPLSPAEKALQGAFLGLGLVDWGQTVNFTQNPALRARMEETNPVLGRSPSRARVNALVPLGLAAHTLGVYALPRPWRTALQVAGLVGEGLAVGNNVARGVSPVWPWKTW